MNIHKFYKHLSHCAYVTRHIRVSSVCELALIRMTHFNHKSNIKMTAPTLFRFCPANNVEAQEIDCGLFYSTTQYNTVNVPPALSQAGSLMSSRSISF